MRGRGGHSGLPFIWFWSCRTCGISGEVDPPEGCPSCGADGDGWYEVFTNEAR